MKYLAALLAGLAAPAAALEIPDTMPVCGVHALLGQQLAALSRHAAPDHCPRIRFSLPPAGAEGKAQVGAYLPDSRSIALAADLDLTTPWGQSVLLHEMVHAAQHAADGLPACLASLEYEAYAVQADFLRAHGAGRDAAVLLAFGAMVARCGDDPSGT